ncbi:hypothetical protein IL306_000881, partial [Fusarium sp. DS 682]
ELETAKSKPDRRIGWVDNYQGIAQLINSFHGRPKSELRLFISLHGPLVGRNHTISVMSIHDPVPNITWLIDVYNLRAKVFWRTGRNSNCLKKILEDEEIVKVFFDVRPASDALFKHYKIRLAGVHDLQLMELATRPDFRRKVKNFRKCIESYGQMPRQDAYSWLLIGYKAERLFDPERGGSHDVFLQRPLPKELLWYCAQDVQIFPQLYAFYNTRFRDQWQGDEWRELMVSGSRERVEKSQSEFYIAHWPDPTRAPRNWPQ